MSALTLRLSAGFEGFGEELAEHVAAGAHLFDGECVDFRYCLWVEADGVHPAGCVLRHSYERSTVLPNVRQRDTLHDVTDSRFDLDNITGCRKPTTWPYLGMCRNASIAEDTRHADRVACQEARTSITDWRAAYCYALGVEPRFIDRNGYNLTPRAGVQLALEMPLEAS